MVDAGLKSLKLANQLNDEKGCDECSWGGRVEEEKRREEKGPI